MYKIKDAKIVIASSDFIFHKTGHKNRTGEFYNEYNIRIIILYRDHECKF